MSSHPLHSRKNHRSRNNSRSLGFISKPFSVESLESRFLLAAATADVTSSINNVDTTTVAAPLVTLAAPTGVLAVNGSSANIVQVSWNAVSGAASYQVWRNTISNSSSAAQIASGLTGSSFSDTSVTIGTTYYYWVVAAGASSTSSFSTIASATGGTLVWSDTFGSDGIKSAWGPFETVDSNNNLVHYTNTTPAQSSSSNPTTLAIVSDPQATNGQALAMSLSPDPSGNGTYDSAEISTEFDPAGAGNNIQYGEIQARIKIPGGSNSNAIWPAFWIQGTDISTVNWPDCGEVDLMENNGSLPGTISSTIHGPMSDGTDYNNGAGVAGTNTLSNGQDYYSSYHVFAMNWGPNSITFSVDGIPFKTFTPANVPAGGTWAFNGHPFFMLLDVCEGFPFAPGTITSTQTMSVDYVRAYSLPAPTSVVATQAAASTPAQVAWNGVNGATSYEVWRNTTNSTASATEIANNVTTTSYTDSSASVGSIYDYWIVAGNVSQTSDFSSSQSVKLTATVTIPSPPATIAYDGTSDVISWIKPVVTGVAGGGTPTGSTTLTFYSGSSPSGTPLAALPVNVGTYTVVANYAGDANYNPAQSSPVIFTITPAASSQLVFTTQPAGAAAGTTISPVIIKIEDQYGNLETTDNSTMNLAIGSAPVGGTFTATSIITISAVNGVATFNNLSFTIAGSYTLLATDGKLASAASSSFSVTAVTTTQPPIIQTIADSAVQFTGHWWYGIFEAGYYGKQFVNDGNLAKGTKSVQFNLTLPASGIYDVSIWNPAAAQNASSVPVDIVTATGTTTVNINEQQNGGGWLDLGSYQFGTSGVVIVRTMGTSGWVVANAVKFTPMTSAPTTPPVPANFVVGAVSKTSVPLSWSEAPANISGFLIQQSTDNQTWATIATPAAGATSYTAIGLTPGGNYYFRIQATGATSNSAFATIGPIAIPSAAAIVQDITSPAVTFTGRWWYGIFEPGYYGTQFVNDGNLSKGTKSVQFNVTLPAAGTYDVAVFDPGTAQNASNVPVDIITSSGTVTVSINEQTGGWLDLGSYLFGAIGSIVIRTTGTTGLVVANAVRFTPVG